MPITSARMIFKPTPGDFKKSKNQLLREANSKIADLERELATERKKREFVQNKLAWALCGVNALGRHFKLPAEEAQKIIVEYVNDNEAKAQIEMQEQMKKEFSEKLKRGEAPEFHVIDRSKEP